MDFDTFKQEIKALGYTRDDFAKLTNIPKRTIDGWVLQRGGKSQETPSWVDAVIKLLKENKEKEATIETLLKRVGKG